MASMAARMKVMTIPVLEDNYAYLLIDSQQKVAFAVDPADAKKVQDAAKQAGVTITGIITTHYHKDHAGGNEQMRKDLPSIKVYGSSIDKVAACTDFLQDGSVVELSENVSVKALLTPCHTKGHLCYLASATNGQQDPVLFTGDTLFVGGCGRFFEGTAAEMYHALLKVIAKLPPATKVFCGHEYTVKNLKFAVWMEPGNFFAKEKYKWAVERRKKGLATVPSTLMEEMTYNPFLRVELGTLQAATGKELPEEIMAEIRMRKDYF